MPSIPPTGLGYWELAVFTRYSADGCHITMYNDWVWVEDEPASP